MIDDLGAVAPSLESLGWREDLDRWAQTQGSDLIRGRVAQVSRGYCLVYVGGEALLAESASIRGQHDLVPTTGDFVLVGTVADDGGTTFVVNAIAPRRSALRRRAAGRVPQPQVLVANIDAVFVMHGLDRELSERRIERQLVLAWDSGATPVVVLTKADQSRDLKTDVALAEAVAPGVEVVAVATLDGDGVDEVASYVPAGKTAAMLGLSGIGKSTLVNALTGGAVQRTGDVRAADGKGRHTTVTRDLIPIPGHGLLVDTPGMREFGLWQSYDGLAATFPEIEAVVGQCRFADCTHHHEPGCTVREAIADGLIAPRRLEHWQDLHAELETQEAQLERFARRAESRDLADAQRRRDGERSNTRKRKGASRKGRARDR